MLNSGWTLDGRMDAALRSHLSLYVYGAEKVFVIFAMCLQMCTR